MADSGDHFLEVEIPVLDVVLAFGSQNLWFNSSLIILDKEFTKISASYTNLSQYSYCLSPRWQKHFERFFCFPESCDEPMRIKRSNLCYQTDYRDTAGLIWLVDLWEWDLVFLVILENCQIWRWQFFYLRSFVSTLIQDLLSTGLIDKKKTSIYTFFFRIDWAHDH